MPRARAAAPAIGESVGEFEARSVNSVSSVSSVMAELQQIQSERRPRRPRSGSGGEELRAPLVARTEPAGHSPPSLPTETPAAGGGYFSIASRTSNEDKGETYSNTILWSLYTLLVFSVLVYMANTRKFIFAPIGSMNLFGTCGSVGDANQLPFSRPAFVSKILHSESLSKVSKTSSILLGVLLFMQLVFACSRGYCALGTAKVDGRIRNTNQSIKLTRVLGWLGTAAVIVAVQMSVFLVGAGLSCAWAPKKIFELFAAVSAGSAIVLGFVEIMNHMTNWYRPKLQRHIGRVLLMVPVYALDSMLTVFYPNGNTEVVCGVLRSLWEAYTIYSFYMFVLEYLQGLAVLQVIEDEAQRAMQEVFGDEEYGSGDTGSGGLGGFSPGGASRTGSGRSSSAESVLLSDLADGGKPVVKLLNRMREEKGEVAHIWPMNYWLKPWSGAVFLARCKSGVLQYVGWQIFCTFIALVTTNIKCPHAPAGTNNCYNEANPSPEYAYLWTQLTLNFSQAWALYCLTYCYKTLKDLLSPISPLGKFMCIKMVVFATFWQQTFFTILFWTSFGDRIQWCDPIECCMLPKGAGDEKYKAHCSAQKFARSLCGFCPVDSQWSSNGTWVGGTNFHVLENNTMQATLVCFEMLFFAIAHRRVFSWRDFVLEGEGDNAKPVARAFADMVDTRDIRGAVSWLVKSRVKETVSDGEMLVDGSIQTLRSGVDGVLVFGRNTVGAVVDATRSIVPLTAGNRRDTGAASQAAPLAPADLDVSMEFPVAESSPEGTATFAQVPPASPLAPDRTQKGVHSPVHGAVGANRFTLDESPPKLAAQSSPSGSGPRE